MKILKIRTTSGFTLIEAMVSIVIFSMIIYGITLLVSGILTNTGFQSNILDNNDQARKVATAFSNEVRGAVISATGSFPIESATSQQIIFYTKTSTTTNRIRYYLLGEKLYKGVTVPIGDPGVYNLAQEVVTAVQSAVASAPGDAIFTYYDDNGTILSDPVNLTQIRNIGITLKIYLQGSRSNINIYTVESSATIRNLKDNL